MRVRQRQDWPHHNPARHNKGRAGRSGDTECDEALWAEALRSWSA